jgi:hypothetical protein
MVMFQSFHDCNFAFEIGEKFRREFRSDDGFDGNHSRFTLQVSQHSRADSRAGRLISWGNTMW